MAKVPVDQRVPAPVNGMWNKKPFEDFMVNTGRATRIVPSVSGANGIARNQAAAHAAQTPRPLGQPNMQGGGAVPQSNPLMQMFMQMMQAMQSPGGNAPTMGQTPQTQWHNINPNYGGGLISGALATQNQGVNNAIRAANRSVTGGPLTSAISSLGNNIQSPGLATAMMNNQAHAQGNVRRGMATSDYFFDKDGNWRQFDYYRDQMTPEAAQQLLGGNPYGTTSTDGTNMGTGGNGGGGGNGGNSQDSMLSQLMADMQAKMDEANAANEARYNQGLDELYGLRHRAQSDINRLGTQQGLDIRREANRTNAAAAQSAQSRGLANSTLPGIMARGVDREKNSALRSLGDTIAQNRLNADNTLTNNITNWIYNREDQAPNYGQLIDLARMFGESGYGQPQAQQIQIPGLQNLVDIFDQMQTNNFNAFPNYNGGGWFV